MNVDKKILCDLNLNQNQLKNSVAENLSTAPSNPIMGQFYFDTTDNCQKQWNGTEWIKVIKPVWEKGTGTISAALIGSGSTATGNYSVAEGILCTSKLGSHTEGDSNKANNYSHAEGSSNEANAGYSHAEGDHTITSGPHSHTEGSYTKTTNDSEHAEGWYNKSNTGSTNADITIHSVGIGTSDTDRQNALDIRKNGDIYYKEDPQDDDKKNNDVRLQTKLNTINEAVAASLNDLNDRVDTNTTNISSIISDTSKVNLIETTYANLVTLRSNSLLVPGQQYRITDYAFTTTQDDTKSAGHAFDIIVTADDVNKLNENARAALHSGDTYFSSCKIEAWQLKYRLDNDTDYYSWVDSTNGKGVIYWMKDEYDNECCYDFKNALFTKEAETSITEFVAGDYYTFTESIGTDGTGAVDGSISQSSLNNVMKIDDEATLPCNILLGEGYANIFGEYSKDNILYNSSANIFGNSSIGNILNTCEYNYFGSNCSGNTLGSNCDYNVFMGFNYSITLGSYCSSNTFYSSSSNINLVGLNRISYYKNNIIQSGVSYVTLTSRDIRIDETNYLQNVCIHQGVSGTDTTLLTITVARNSSKQINITTNNLTGVDLPYQQSMTINPSAWDTSTKLANLTVTGVTETTIGRVEPTNASSPYFANAGIFVNSISSGIITLECTTIPTVSISIVITIERLS